MGRSLEAKLLLSWHEHASIHEVGWPAVLLALELLLLLKLQVWRAEAQLGLQLVLELLRVYTLNLGVMAVHELLDSLNGCVLELLEHLWADLLDFLQVVQADVLVSVRLKDIAGDFSAFEALGVDEVAVLAACASIWPVVVSAGDCSEVARLDDLSRLHQALLRGNLVDLGQLQPSLLIDLLKLDDLFVGESDEHLRRLTGSFLEQTADVFLLF